MSPFFLASATLECAALMVGLAVFASSDSEPERIDAWLDEDDGWSEEDD